MKEGRIQKKNEVDMTGKEKEWNEETKEEKVIGNGREMLKKN